MTEIWVNDQLHSILGMSDKTLAKYLMAEARKTDSAEDFVEKLESTGAVDVSQAQMNSFAKELWGRMPHPHLELRQRKEAELEQKRKLAAATEKWNQSFQMLSDHSSDEEQPCEYN